MAEEKKFIPKYIRRKIAEGEISLTFTKTGITYRFTPGIVAKQQIKAFTDITDLSFGGIQDLISAKLSENDENEDGAIPYKVQRQVMFKPLERGKDIGDIAEGYAEKVFSDIAETWKDAPIGEMENYNRSAELIFQESIENTVYGQDFQKLDANDRNNVVLVKDCGGKGPQYFYTKNEFVNGYQIWYKALNPFIWYGIET